MILGINLPQGVCFVGLVQRFVVFSLKIYGFTLIFLEMLEKFEFSLKTTGCLQAMTNQRQVTPVCLRLKC
jgi:hypothetical protein